MANQALNNPTGSRGVSPLGRDPFSLFRREMDRVFDDFFSPAEARSFATAPVAFPSVDVSETDQAYRVTAELPGLDEKDVQISLRDNILTITGEKRDERREEDGGRTYAERIYGRFQRTLAFDQEVDADRVQATFKNGVLTIELPKSAKAGDKTRRIDIKSQQ